MSDVLSPTATANWRDYLEMCKPRVVLLMLLCSLVGMFLATPGMVPWDILLFGNLGIALVAGSAAALNHWWTPVSMPTWREPATVPLQRDVSLRSRAVFLSR